MIKSVFIGYLLGFIFGIVSDVLAEYMYKKIQMHKALSKLNELEKGVEIDVSDVER